VIRKTVHFCSKTVLLGFEILFGVALLVAVLLAFLFARFSAGPVDVTWAQPYIQQALSDAQSDVTITFGGVVAQWDRFTGPITLGISDFRVAHQGRTLVAIPQAGISVAKAPLLFGKIAPVAVIVKKPQIHIVRDANGQFRFSMMQPDNARKPSEGAENEGISFQDIGNRLFLGGRIMPSTSLTWLSELEVMRIEDASVMAEDNLAGVTWVISDTHILLDRDVNDVVGDVTFRTPAQTVDSHIGFEVKRDHQSIATNFTVQNFDIALLSRNIMALSVLQGRQVVINGAFQSLHDLQWGLKSIDGKINTGVGAESERFLTVKALPRADHDGLDVTLSLDSFRIDDVAKLWPKDQWGDLGITPWVTQQLSQGVFENISVTVSLDKTPSTIPLEQRIAANFTFKDLSVDYRAPLTTITKAQGTGAIKNDTLVIDVAAAALGDMAIKAGKVTITNLTKPDPGTATINIDLQGSVPSVLNYIASEPIALKEQVGIDPSKAKGQADMKVTVAFPAVKDLQADQVSVDVTATLNDVLIPAVIGSADLTGGPFNLNVDGGAFTLGGKGFLGGQPIDLVYQEYINLEQAPFSSKIAASVMTSPDLRQKINVNLSDYIDGDALAKIDYIQDTDGNTTLKVDADLTQAKVFVRPLGFEKPVGNAGRATATVLMKKDEVQQIKDLTITMGKDAAKGGRLLFGKLGAARDIISGGFDSISLNNASIFKLNFKNTVTELSLNIQGESIDARPFLKNDTQTSQPLTKDVKVTARAAKMRTGDAANQFIKNPTLDIAINKNNIITRLNLAAVSGDGNFRANLTPNTQGVMGLNIVADDAGATLYNFGIYDTLKGGTMSITGQQIAGAGLNDIAGQAEIREFRVVKAPVLAQLISAFSLSGLGNLLGNDGISFKNLRTQFTWRDTAEGRMINLRNGRTSGASIGLTFGGLINQDNNTIDVSGTFVPVSEVNKLVSRIPVVGQLLTGGRDGGVIAATYAVKGNTADPRVIINPLSVLAPGFLRSILFESDTSSAAPPPKPAKRTVNQ
jgi:hypothetical protein